MRERIISKATVLAPGNNVDTRSKSDTVGIGSKLSDSSSIVVSYKGHFYGKTGVLTGEKDYSFDTVPIDRGARMMMVKRVA